MAAPLPDHYRTLGVAPSAGAEAVKTAYRSLARKYHPDAAPDNPHAAAQFRAVQEAYSTLSHPARRRKYDEARWLAGLQGGGKAEAVTGATLLRDARRLQQHVEAVGRSRMQPLALQRIALFLLEEPHLAVLAKEGNTAVNMQLAAALLHAVTGLKTPLLEPVLQRLRRLQPVAPELEHTLQDTLQRQRAADRQAAWRPLWIVLFTIVLCALLARLAGR